MQCVFVQVTSPSIYYTDLDFFYKRVKHELKKNSREIKEKNCKNRERDRKREREKKREKNKQH